MTGRLRGIVARLAEDERVRFILVGALNTAVGYSLFVLIELLIGRHSSYLVSLYGSYVLATIVAFTAHRHYTFRATNNGNVFVDFIRFQSVNLVALAVNSLSLPALVELADVPPIASQALIVTVTMLISYFGHKFFSFHRASKAVEPAQEDLSE